MPTELANRAKMAVWAAKVERLIAKKPGSDEGFPPESIARDAGLTFAQSSTWGMICDEMLDTQHTQVHFERAWEELRRRGITNEEITEMRRFAWLTVGWMNFEMALWEWGGLDASDIRYAIEWQHRDGWISTEDRNIKLAYLNRYESVGGP